MTIRRVTILFALLAFVALAASGQTVSWQGAPSPSAPLPPSTGCNNLPAAAPFGTACVTYNVVYPSLQFIVNSPPSLGTPTWSYQGFLPTGMSLSSTGVLQGTPTAAGSYTFTISATYSGVSQIVTSTQYMMGIQALTLAVAQNNGLPGTAVAGTSVGVDSTASPWYQATATGGYPLISSTGPYYKWSFASGSQPDGLSIDPNTGVIFGTPNAAGTYQLYIVATDAFGQTNTFSPQLIVTGAAGFMITTTSLPNGGTGVAYNQTLTETGGPSSGIIWSLISGTLPPGLAVSSNSNNTGTISGTPTTVGTYNFTVQASYTVSGSTFNATQALSIIVSLTNTLTMATPSTVSGSVGQALSMQFTATGGNPTYTYTLVSGSGTLPPGLTLSSPTGLISGTATATGVYTVTVQVTDSLGHQFSASGTFNIATSLTMGNPSAVTALVGAAVSIQFTANGGVPPYTYTSSAGLPAGLSLNSQTGLVSGTVATAGTYPLTIQVTDSSNRAVSATGTITVATPLTMANPAAVTGSVGATVSIQFTAVGGTQPYTYSVQAGSLPTGLTLNPQTGLVTGIATQTGGFTFLVQVTDSSSQILTATATGSITTTVLTVTGTISLVSSTGVAYTPGGAVPAGTQPTVTVTLGTPPPEAVTGTLSVAYFRSLDGLESREVAFSIVSPKFTVASGSTQAVFTGGPVALIVGTAAGQGEVAVAFQDALGNNIASPTVQPFTFSVAGTAPVITSFAISAPSNNSYTVTVIGYSSTLDMSNAVFNLVPTSGTNLASSSVTVSLSSAFTLWYGSSQSNQFGGQFMLTVPLNFSVSGGVSSNPIDAATVTLTNSKGSTTSNSANP